MTGDHLERLRAVRSLLTPPEKGDGWGLKEMTAYVERAFLASHVLDNLITDLGARLMAKVKRFTYKCKLCGAAMETDHYEVLIRRMEHHMQNHRESGWDG